MIDNRQAKQVGGGHQSFGHGEVFLRRLDRSARVAMRHDQRTGVMPAGKTKDVARVKRTEVGASPKKALGGDNGLVGVQRRRPKLLDVLRDAIVKKRKGLQRLSNFNE